MCVFQNIQAIQYFDQNGLIVIAAKIIRVVGGTYHHFIEPIAIKVGRRFAVKNPNRAQNASA